LTIGEGDADGGNYQGSIQDGAGGSTAMTKTGSGTITLSGTNTYTGSTTVNAGTLLVNGTLAAGSAVSVAGGILGGTGTVGGSVTVGAAGSVAPGAGGVGTLAIGGGLDISAMAGGAGKLLFELAAPAGTSDRIAVTGTLTIGSGLLGLSDFDFANVGSMGEGTYILITSGGAVSGTLNNGDITGNVGDLTGVALQINGNNLELMVPSQEPQPSVFRFR
jgi:autotransporter-associated beta strand protein